jgi:preprotein translocase subunit SecD
VVRRKLIVSLVSIMVVAYGAFLLTIITDSKPSLGLDLQGGISVTQQPKPGTAYSDESLDLAVEKIRERVDSLGVAEPEILRQGDTIVVNLPGVENQQQAVELVQVTGQVYLRPVVSQCQVLDTSPTTTTASGSSTTVSGSSTTGAATSTSPSTTAAGGPSRAVSSGNTTTTAPADTSTTAPTTTDPTTTAAVTPASATTVPGPTTTAPTLDENGIPVQESDPNNNQLLPVFSSDPPEYCVVGPQQGTGEVFTNANAVIIPGKGWGVTVDLRPGAEGEDIWNNLAGQCYNRAETCPTGQIAIDLDGSLQSVATVQEPTFSGSVEISGSFTEGEAKNLARVLNSGSLPVQLQLQSVQNVSPSLGKDSLHAAVIAGLVGVLLVLLFMIAYYRLLGFIVALGMTVSMALLWGVITWLSKTSGLALSLAGIAGIIVSVGVTVDSYVVFFERLKDEVRSGKTMRNSAQRGFQAAWHTIVMADLVSLIGAFVLWYLTVGAVRGFAFFLGLATTCDLLVAYFFTRPMVLLLARTKWMERQKVMGIEVASQGASS